MKSTGLSVAFALVLGYSITLAAQGPAGPTNQSPAGSPSPQTSSPSGSQEGGRNGTPPRQAGGQGEVRLTGCVQSSSGPSTTGSARGAYTLMNAKMSSSQASGSDRTSSAGGNVGSGNSGAGAPSPRVGAAAGSSAGNSTYTLSGSADLAQHVGHQVEVIGTMPQAGSSISSATPGSGAATPGNGSAARGSADSASPSADGARARGGADRAAGGVGTAGTSTAQELRVTSVRMISTTCDR